MQTKHLFQKRLTSILLAGVLMASPAAVVFGASQAFYPPKAHSGQTLRELPCTGVDGTQLRTLLGEFELVCEKEDQEEAVRTLYEEIMDEYDRQIDQDALLTYREAVTNSEEDAEAASAAESACRDLYYEMVFTFQKGLDSEYRPILLELLPDEGWADYIEQEEPPKEESEVLTDRQSELVQLYFQRMGDLPSAVVDGETWTFERYNDDLNLDEEQDDKIDQALWKAANASVGEIYRELAALRKEEALQEGYDSYRDLAYDLLYYRDYTSEDAEAVRASVKEVLAPVYRELVEKTGDCYSDAILTLGDGDVKKILADIAPYIGEVSPVLQEAFDALTNQELYDCAVDPQRRDQGYTVTLPGCGLAMIYLSMSGMFTDYEDMIHEFGHFNSIYHDTSHSAFQEESMDVSEICSQGLQLLMLPYMRQIVGEETGEYLRLHTLLSILESVLEGFEADEFESAVVEDPDMSLEEINALSGHLLYAYGLAETDRPDYKWVDKSHFFEMPFYYLSYATSALGALELLDAAREDREDAVDRYLVITRDASDCGFLEIIEKAGLPDPFTEETIGGIAETVRASMEEEPDAEQQSSGSAGESEDTEVQAA